MLNSEVNNKHQDSLWKDAYVKCGGNLELDQEHRGELRLDMCVLRCAETESNTDVIN